MPIQKKTTEEIETLHEGGQKLAGIIHELAEMVAPGVTSKELNDRAKELFAASGGEPAFYQYKPRGVTRGFPGYVCVSVNDVIVHGMPEDPVVEFQEGDVVKVDGGMTYGGLVTDMAVTATAGDVSDKVRRLIDATREALSRGVQAAQPGGRIGDIGAAVSEVAERSGFGVAQGLAGHGVGHSVHEDPFVPNVGEEGKGIELEAGIVIAIEPMFMFGSGAVEFSDDQFTVFTADGSISAHFEHTVAVTEDGPEILTRDN